MRVLRHIVTVRPALAALLCVSGLLGLAAAQSSKRKEKTPRALALIEWPAKGAPRVVPITILIDGRFQDAGIYLANPVPMALDPGTVYQVEQSGEPAGFVTITEAKQPQGGNWFAEATFRPTGAQTASARKPEPVVRKEVEEGPPKLRKSSPQPKPDASGAPATTEPKPGSSAPANTSPPETPSSDKGSSAPGDEGRPVLRKPAEQAAAAPEAKTQPAAPEPDQSGRPILRRGAGPEQAVALPGSVAIPAGAHASTSSAIARGVPATTAPPVRVLAAISDADGPEPKPYVFHWTEKEKDKLSEDMQSLAAEALQKYATAHGGHAGKLEEVEVRAFDLTYNNEPDLVLTAAARPAPTVPGPRRAGARTAPAPPPPDPSLTYWITLLAREDLNGDLRLLQAWATDSKHLDAFPRRELIDAIDADGDGRGELLFRLIGDRGRNFALYRVRYGQVTELYSSGGEE